MKNKKTIRGYSHINVGCSHEELIDEWLGITIWGGEYEGLEELNTENGITVYRHTDSGGDIINHNVNNGLPDREHFSRQKCGKYPWCWAFSKWENLFGLVEFWTGS